MRKLLPAALLLIAGCGYGPIRQRPGSDMALPQRVGAIEGILRSLACTAEKRDSLRRTPASTGKEAAQPICSDVKDSIKR